MEMRGAICVSANSSMVDIGRVSESRLRKMMGCSEGFCLWNEGGEGRPLGSSGVTAAMALCTSTAAPSISRSSENCRLMLVEPVELREVIESRPAIPVNWRSSTLATADDMVFGSAPGRLQLTLMVG